MTPAEAGQHLLDLVVRLPILADPRHLADDIFCLRQVFTNDSGFFSALHSIERELIIACRNPAVHGKALTHGYHGWRRCAFQSRRTQKHGADLRLVFRPLGSNALELRAFGHRSLPDSLYYRVRAR